MNGNVDGRSKNPTFRGTIGLPRGWYGVIRLFNFFSLNLFAGEDDDDLEINYVIDKNLINGMAIVDLHAGEFPPEQDSPDPYWGKSIIVMLYAIKSAKRPVHPMVGSVAEIEFDFQNIF